jgi:hypothetical protein
MNREQLRELAERVLRESESAYDSVPVDDKPIKQQADSTKWTITFRRDDRVEINTEGLNDQEIVEEMKRQLRDYWIDPPFMLRPGAPRK